MNIRSLLPVALRPRLRSASHPMLSRRDREKIAAILSLVNDRAQPNLNALSVAVRNIDLLALNVKAFGYDLARQLQAALPIPEGTQARHVGLGWKPSVQADLESDWAAHWCRELKIPVVFHRKIWEVTYVLQQLHDAGLLQPGMRGLGFGCAGEPLASYFASRGITSLVTDLPVEDQRTQGWRATSQHAASLDDAFKDYLVDRERFDALVRFRPVDMNQIPEDLGGWDFCWSMCALEHLGSIKQGLAFVENSLRPLRPGGTAVHTTEFNINPDGPTIDHWPGVLFQRRHIEKLTARLRARGHTVAALDFDTGDKPMDRFIDLPPWHDGTWEQISRGLGVPHHMKVGLDGFVSTCYGLVVTKAG